MSNGKSDYVFFQETDVPSTNFLAKRCAQHFLARTLFAAIHFRKVQNALEKNGHMPRHITLFG